MKIEHIISMVEEKIGSSTLASMITFVSAAKPNLWGEIKPPSFIRQMVACTVYKDMKAIGYQTLNKKINYGYKLNHKSLQHNIQIIRKELGRWGKGKIELGNKYKWKMASLRVEVPKNLKKKLKSPLLWTDSSDFPRAKFKGYSKKGPWHSFKLNGPGRRYMFVRNGSRKVVKLWGGYTPKLYDGYFVEDHKDEIDEKLAGSTLIGDNHFTYGAQYLENVKIATPLGAIKRNSEVPEELEADEGNSANAASVYEFEGGKTRGRLTKEEEEWKSGIQKLRARVEGLFGFLKSTFKSLNTPFQESARQQDALVYYAVGIFNMLK